MSMFREDCCDAMLLAHLNLERFEQLPSDGGREQLGVGPFRDRCAGVAEELADGFEAEAAVDEIAAECAPECVRADGGAFSPELVRGQPWRDGLGVWSRRCRRPA